MRLVGSNGWLSRPIWARLGLCCHKDLDMVSDLDAGDDPKVSDILYVGNSLDCNGSSKHSVEHDGCPNHKLLLPSALMSWVTL